MACNCEKNKKFKWVYVYPDGRKKQDYTSEVQAQAAKIRNKGGTYTRVQIG